MFTWKPYIDFELYQFGLVHTDHQTTGQRILDCVYPSARDYLAFPELLQVIKNKNKNKNKNKIKIKIKI